MKMKKYVPLILSTLLFAACQKAPLNPPDLNPPAVNQPEELTPTTYDSLGSYDSLGTPGYLISPRDTVSSGMLSYVKNTLKEKVDLRTTHPELLSTKTIADIAITHPADVFVTFVSQITTSKNTLAFYTYPTNNPPADEKHIKKITYIFPNAGPGTKLKAGDKVKIGRFEAGTSIGFVVLRNAWSTTAKHIDTSVVHFYSNDALNPEVDPTLKKHAVLINYPAENKTLIGFENTDRRDQICDHDFNDVVIYATVTP